MIYVMSDIHGRLDKYKQALATIDFSDNDTLFVIGDVIDRGSDSCKILQDMMYRTNVYPILGNHEYMALNSIRFLMKEITDENIDDLEINEDILIGLQEWLGNGGKTTFDEFNKLEQCDKVSIIEYLEEFLLFEEVRCKEVDYILVHAGLTNFSVDKDLNDYQIYELVFDKPNYDQVYFQDKILITGHTPTRVIDPNHGDRIIRKNNHIAIDCGCGYGGQLAVLCLDNGAEYYI